MNVNDLTNAKLVGKTKFARFKDKFNAEWNKPNVDVIKARAWQEMSPEIKQALAQRVPDAVKNMNKRYGGQNG